MVRKEIGVAAVACLLLLGASADAANAVTRYAAPGGTINDNLCTNSSPLTPRCTIYAAAQGPDVSTGDSVVIEPGNYSDTAGDLGPSEIVTPVAQTVGGAAGQSRPVITLGDNLAVAFTVNSGHTLSHLELDTAVRPRAVYVPAGVADDIIVRSSVTGAGAQPCLMLNGVLRDSACLASGDDAVAVSADVSGNVTPKLRNVTAVSSGGGATRALLFGSASGLTTASVKSTIAVASATGKDIYSHATGTGGSTVDVDHSNYSSQQSVGSASIVDQGGNQSVEPVLATDGYHEQPSSAATIDLGATDADSGAFDPDGQYRSIDTTDIGADELGHPTTTELSCSPSSLALGSGGTNCHVLVTDTAPVTGGPLGTVTFGSSDPGTFGGGNQCTLDPVEIGAVQGECTITYTPSAIGSGNHQLTGTYSGDLDHEVSHGSTAVAVTAAPPAGGSTGPATSPTSTPTLKRCKKGRKLRHGRCVKKHRK